MNISLLIEPLKTIPDWRRGRAVQHPLWLMLLMTLLGVMGGGYTSLRGLADFMLRHQEEVAQYFGLSKTTLPLYSTIRDMTHHVDVIALVELFMGWSKTHPMPPGHGVALDGKALGVPSKIGMVPVKTL